MKKDLTEIIFILDKSGSMKRLTDDTIGGFNSYIESQKKEAGEAKVTTVLFNNTTEILHNGVNIQDIQPLTDKEYCAMGTTALLDAIGVTLTEVGDRLNKTPEEDRPEKVIVVIMTDGEENSSVEYKRSQIKEMIEEQTNKYNWQFVFLGANIDSVSEAGSIGISPQSACDYGWSPQGVETTFACLDSMTKGYRGTGKIDNNWKDGIK